MAILNAKQQTGATLTAEEEDKLQLFNANTRLTGFDPHLGTVYCASGYSSSICSPGQLWPSSTILHDWGLVKLHPKRAQGLGQMTSVSFSFLAFFLGVFDPTPASFTFIGQFICPYLSIY